MEVASTFLGQHCCSSSGRTGKQASNAGKNGNVFISVKILSKILGVLLASALMNLRSALMSLRSAPMSALMSFRSALMSLIITPGKTGKTCSLAELEFGGG